MSGAKLALFDCDGTLADSQHAIVAAMEQAFAGNGLPTPPRPAIRAIIGLSVPAAVRRLAPELGAADSDALAEAYRHAYFIHRTAAGAGPEPLYDGIPDLLDRLAEAGWLLGIATGKSQRGLVRLLDAHGIRHHFVTLQTADLHPSKPDPAMALAAIAEAGVSPSRTVVIGDTGFDMAMARAAGAQALGVTWGYHLPDELTAAGAQHLADDPAALPALMLDLLETTA
jgi:phosphoglycolate phosphatase